MTEPRPTTAYAAPKTSSPAPADSEDTLAQVTMTKRWRQLWAKLQEQHADGNVATVIHWPTFEAGAVARMK